MPASLVFFSSFAHRHASTSDVRSSRADTAQLAMGLSNSCIRHFHDVFSYVMGGSGEAQAHLVASEGECLGTSGVPHAGADSESRAESVEEIGTSSGVQQRIQHSMRHWSQVTDCMSPEEHGEAEIDNRAVFLELQSHPQWGGFFQTFGYDTEIRWRAGELEMGSKFAEGGQAELFHAHVTWKSAFLREQDVREGNEHVLKVFKKGTLLRQLQSQWPEGMFVRHVDIVERTDLGKPQDIRYNSYIWYGTLLKDGRFGFLMTREEEDLRSIIDRNMLTNDGHHHGPFSLGESERIIYDIALGMDKLHSLNIVHRDLKASNVLVRVYDGGNHHYCFIADYECSIGVIGTGFFRALEILRAIKNRKMELGIFTKAVDVYSYGMVCYEILTGKLPFEGHLDNGYDNILNGKRPEVPEYVSDWMCDLLQLCWQSNPIDRPTFRDILNFLLDKSAACRKLVDEVIDALPNDS